jgi:hypothetical protein
MFLKTVFLLIILWFILVAVGNMVRAIRSDSMAARQHRPYEPPLRPRRFDPPPPQETRAEWTRRGQPGRMKTYGPFRNGEPVPRPPRSGDVEDARFTDLS